MSDCDQGCHKMDHKDHGAKELVDIDKTVDKDREKAKEVVEKKRKEIDEEFKQQASGQNVLKKTECQ
ncbi:unnamed protein product [Caenorhabditis brenneri]